MLYRVARAKLVASIIQTTSFGPGGKRLSALHGKLLSDRCGKRLSGPTLESSFA
jgi:hypothetical protein